MPKPQRQTSVPAGVTPLARAPRLSPFPIGGGEPEQAVEAPTAPAAAPEPDNRQPARAATSEAAQRRNMPRASGKAGQPIVLPRRPKVRLDQITTRIDTAVHEKMLDLVTLGMVEEDSFQNLVRRYLREGLERDGYPADAE